MKRLIPQYSIRTTLMFVTLIGLGLAWFVPLWLADTREARIRLGVGKLGKISNWASYGRDRNLPFAVTLSPTTETPNADDLLSLKQINKLKLEGPMVTDSWLHHLKTEYVQNLRFLDLTGTKISDSGLANLPAMPELYELNLSATKVSDAGLLNLDRIPSLRRLCLDDTVIGDAGVENIVVALPGLRVLQAYQSKITDDGLMALSKLRWFGAVGAHNTAVTAEGAERLVSRMRENNVNVRVEHGTWPPP